MFRNVFGLELRQQLKSPLFWFVALVLAAVAFGAASSDVVTLGGGIGNIHRNAPYVVISMLGIFSVLGLFLIPIFVAGAALRDFSCNTAELVLATPVPRSAYLGGRFAAGWVASVLVLIAVAFGLWLGSLMPWLDAARLGPTPWAAYGWGLGVIVLPNLFFLAALIFLLATLTRSMLGAYVGVIAFFVLWTVAGLALGHGNLSHQTAGALMNPFGMGAVDLVTRYWTAFDRNTRVPGLAGVILGNRALWLAIGVVLLGAALVLFKPERRGLRRARHRAEPPAVAAGPVQVVLPLVTLRGGFAARWLQFRRQAWLDSAGVLKGTAFIVMLVLGLANFTANLAFTGQMYGTHMFPVTHLTAQAMAGGYEWLLLIILGFYAGELVWREREARVSEIVDAFPTPDWLPLLAKVTALAVVILVFLVVGALWAVGYQLVHGFTAIEPLLYLKFIGLDFIDYFLFALLALVLQAWANNKFIGYALIVAYFILVIAFGALHFSDNLYLLGNTPSVPYSDMNGFGTFWIGKVWFGAYWLCLYVALLVTSALYWTRGTVSGWGGRARIALQRFRAPAVGIFAAGLVGFIAIGIFIWHNTHGLYRYEGYYTQQRLAANYEKDYAKYQGMAQPRIADVNVHVALFPRRKAADITGHYTLVNRHAQPIDTLLVQLPTPETREFKLALDFPAHTTTLADAAQGFYLYKLATPLAPGASMPFTFHEQIAYPGFANSPAPGSERLVHNGTFLTNVAFPHFCYDTGRQLTDNNHRRKYGLGPAKLLPPRSDTAARMNNLISCDADWVHFETTISTVPDQVAVAPGYLQKEWVKDGRRYFHYVQDSPILDFFSFQSARYKVANAKWHDVALQVFYDPHERYNVDRILKAMQLALTYDSAHFGPFQFRQLRVLEFPGYATFAQSFPDTIPYSEDFMLQDLRKPSDIDYITYVTAHETSHQWWAHQAIGGSVQGVSMLDESLAQYSALMVMKHLYGPTKMRKFLKYELDSYLSGRAGDKNQEEPLAKVENTQPYIYYRKGSVIFYALQDYIGEDKVDAALRAWLDKVKFQQPPYTDTHELLADIRAEAGPRYQDLITDFFDKITVFDDRMVKATAKKLPDGKYEVTMHVHAAKYYANGKGKETRAKTLGIPIEIGVFAKAKDGEEQDERPLYLAKVPVKDGDSTITVTVDGAPYQAGIDPFNELIDRVSSDNRASVTIQ